MESFTKTNQTKCEKCFNVINVFKIDIHEKKCMGNPDNFSLCSVCNNYVHFHELKEHSYLHTLANNPDYDFDDGVEKQNRENSSSFITRYSSSVRLCFEQLRQSRNGRHAT